MAVQSKMSVLQNVRKVRFFIGEVIQQRRILVRKDDVEGIVVPPKVDERTMDDIDGYYEHARGDEKACGKNKVKQQTSFFESQPVAPFRIEILRIALPLST